MNIQVKRVKAFFQQDYFALSLQSMLGQRLQGKHIIPGDLVCFEK